MLFQNENGEITRTSYKRCSISSWKQTLISLATVTGEIKLFDARRRGFIDVTLAPVDESDKIRCADGVRPLKTLMVFRILNAGQEPKSVITTEAFGFGMIFKGADDILIPF